MAEKENISGYFGHRERIRQKYIQTEGNGMADYEILELLLTYAIPRKDVKPIAKELIDNFGDINGVISAPMDRLMQIKGIKEVAAVLLKLAKTCAVRGTWEYLHEKDAPIVSNWDILEDYCRNLMADLDIEEFHIIYLDAKLQLIKEEKIQKGTIDMVTVHPREVIKAALAANAKGIILLHNHPSGNIKPSDQDVFLTDKIVEAARSIDLFVFDHIVVSKNDVYSMRVHDTTKFYVPKGYEPK